MKLTLMVLIDFGFPEAFQMSDEKVHSKESGAFRAQISDLKLGRKEVNTCYTMHIAQAHAWRHDFYIMLAASRDAKCIIPRSFSI